MADQTVLDFIANAPASLPTKITVERTSQSRYPSLLLSRLYRKRLGATPVFVSYSKKGASGVKGALEEFSVFDAPGPKLFFLEGFHFSFVDALDLPPDSYVVGETTTGELKVLPFTPRSYRDVLRVLVKQMGLRLSLRDITKLDWTICFTRTLRTSR